MELTKIQYDKIADALASGIMFLNVRERTNVFGITEDEDNIRQKMCEAYAVLAGYAVVGNHARVDETLAAMKELGVVNK